MKKTLIFFCFIATVQTSLAQINRTLITKADLTSIKKPLERFTATINYLENELNEEGNGIDSTISIDLQRIAKQLKNDSLLAISYNWIGSYFGTKGKSDEEIEYLYKALALAEKYKDKRRISSIYFDLYSAYMVLGRRTEAFGFSKKGGENLPDKTSPKYDFMLVQYQLTMTSFYREKKQLDSALFYAHLSNQTAERINTNLIKYQTLKSLSNVYQDKNEPEIGLVYLRKAQTIAQHFKGNQQRFDFFAYNFLMLDRQDSTKQAGKWADSLWLIAQQEQDQRYRLYAATTKRKLYDKLNNIDSAYYYSKLETEIREVIFDKDKLSAIEALGLKEQLRKIDEVEIEEEAKQQRKQNIQYIFIAIGIVTFLILFFLLSRSIVFNEKWISFFGILGLLIVFEFINLLIHPLLERVTHHNPMLMLLALVALASLLIPLHHRLEKWIKIKMTEKNKGIRLANAKKTIEELEQKG